MIQFKTSGMFKAECKHSIPINVAENQTKENHLMKNGRRAATELNA